MHYHINKYRSFYFCALLVSGPIFPVLAADTAYIPSGKTALTYVDTSIDTIIKKVPSSVINTSSTTMTITADGTTIYQANMSGGNIGRIDAVSGEVAGEITIDTLPTTSCTGGLVRSLLVSPDGEALYATVKYLCNSIFTNQLVKINTSTGEIVAFTHGGLSGAMALSPDGSIIYHRRFFTYVHSCNFFGACSSSQAEYTRALQTDDLTPILDTVNYDTPGATKDLVVSPGGEKVYELWHNNGNSFIITRDAANLSVQTSLPVALAPASNIAMSPDGSTLYIIRRASTDGVGGILEIIDIENGVVTASHAIDIDTSLAFSVPSMGNTSLGLTSDGGKLLILAPGNERVFTFNTSTHMIENSLSLDVSYTIGRFVAPRQAHTSEGRVDRVVLDRIICRNLTTRQSVIIYGPTYSFDCENAGLLILPGESIDILLKGTAN
ncbi:MAG: hypothetical protein OEY52_08650 [Gammaproteobacteria bacterium]|nr:hypothetical protein [Gammaproteobacteria bacterium]